MGFTPFDDYRGIKVVGTDCPIPEMQWGLLAEINEKEAFAPLRRIRVLFVSLLISVPLVAWLIGVFVSRKITAPIHKLHEGTEIIAEGNLDYKVGTDSKDEIGQLSRAFDKMTEDLKKKTASIDELNEEIAGRKRAEAQKEALMKELEKSNRNLQDFVYVASHDLREPLRKVSAFGRILADSLKGKLDEDQQENLGFVIDGANRMQQMTDALLTYSRVTTTAKPYQRVDLNEVICDLRDLELASQLEETNGNIEVPQSLPAVFADSTQMHQLLQNLIGNSLKYHKKDSAPKVIVRANVMNNGMVRVEVEDDGVGIEEDHYGEVFTMFRRLHSRSEYEGTGIGLTICKRIVERHGGEIGVESVPGAGSTFWFTIAAASLQGNYKKEVGVNE